MQTTIALHHNNQLTRTTRPLVSRPRAALDWNWLRDTGALIPFYRWWWPCFNQERCWTMTFSGLTHCPPCTVVEKWRKIRSSAFSAIECKHWKVNRKVVAKGAGWSIWKLGWSILFRFVYQIFTIQFRTAWRNAWKMLCFFFCKNGPHKIQFCTKCAFVKIFQCFHL